MRRLIIAPSAAKDLQDIHDLCRQPGMGRRRDEVMPGCRSFVEGKYVILYQPLSDEAIEVKRIVHSKRDLRKALE